MKYKTLYYNVEPIAQLLPDDCLRIIAKYAYDDSKYKCIQERPTIRNYNISDIYFSDINLRNRYLLRCHRSSHNISRIQCFKIISYD